MLFHPIYQNLFQSSKTKIGNPVDEGRNALFFSKKNKKKSVCRSTNAFHFVNVYIWFKRFFSWQSWKLLAHSPPILRDDNE